MEAQNHFYGHSAAWAAYLRRRRPRHVAGLAQHGWTAGLTGRARTSATSRRAGMPGRRRGRLFVWSHTGRGAGTLPRRSARRRLIGAQLLYLASAAGAPPPARDERDAVVLDARARHPDPAGARRPRGTRAVAGARPRDRPPPACTPRTRRTLTSSRPTTRPATASSSSATGWTPTSSGGCGPCSGRARRVVSNRLSTPVFYAATLGADIAVYGDALRHRRASRRRAERPGSRPVARAARRARRPRRRSGDRRRRARRRPPAASRPTLERLLGLGRAHRRAGHSSTGRRRSLSAPWSTCAGRRRRRPARRPAVTPRPTRSCPILAVAARRATSYLPSRCLAPITAAGHPARADRGGRTPGVSGRRQRVSTRPSTTSERAASAAATTHRTTSQGPTAGSAAPSTHSADPRHDRRREARLAPSRRAHPAGQDGDPGSHRRRR